MPSVVAAPLTHNLPDIQSKTNIKNELVVEAILGYSGQVKNGFLLDLNANWCLYALGSEVVLDSYQKQAQDMKPLFLTGHSNTITAMALSKSGRYLATGQQSYLGHPADVLVWDLFHNQDTDAILNTTVPPSPHLLRRFSLHKLRVQDLAFSADDRYLVTLGGQDDNYLAIWDIVQGVAVAGHQAARDASRFNTCVAFLNKDPCTLITAGHHTVRIWNFDPVQKKMTADDCQMGTVKRIVQCVAVDAQDQYMYCGTTTGDILQIGIETKMFHQFGPPKPKDNFSLGVTALRFTPSGQQLVVGCGNGVLALLDVATLNIVKTTLTTKTTTPASPTKHKSVAASSVTVSATTAADAQALGVQGEVTSLAFVNPQTLLVCTSLSNRYHIPLNTFQPTLVASAHPAKVNDITFPDHCSDLFATASDTDVRIWNSRTRQVLVRMTVKGAACEAVVFKKDGTSVLTGWSDGTVRGFGPESGRLQFTIHDAHRGGVTALAVTEPLVGASEPGVYRIVSGGRDGQVRVWRVTKDKQILENAMKEHKEHVTCIQLRKNQRECVSSSIDGSTIVWDLNRGVRNQVMFSPTFFKAVAYFPDESQILTSGTDRKVTYWEAYDGSLIREIDVTENGTLNGLAVTPDGKYFLVSGDKKVFIYLYEEGTRVFVGRGHSTEITKLRVSPDSRQVVSVGTDGAIFLWKLPFNVGTALQPPLLTQE